VTCQLAGDHAHWNRPASSVSSPRVMGRLRKNRWNGGDGLRSLLHVHPAARRTDGYRDPHAIRSGPHHL
jgi:hypothetical protein